MSAAGMLRVTARRGGLFRRAGFAFGPEPRDLPASALTPAQVLAIVTEPMLTAEISYDGEVWYAPPADFRAGLIELVDATSGMTPGAVGVRLSEAGVVDDLVRRAMFGEVREPQTTPPIGGVDRITELERKAALAEGAIAAARPGRGAGADHPGASFEAVPQPIADPNPALPASGGTSDAGVSVRQADDVPLGEVDQPVPAATLAAEVAEGVVTPADPTVASPIAASRRPSRTHSS